MSENLYSSMYVQDGTEIQAFVAEISHQMVGVAIIRREEVTYLISVYLIFRVIFNSWDLHYINRRLA